MRVGREGGRKARQAWKWRGQQATPAHGVGDVFRRGFVEKALDPRNLDGSSMELQHARHAKRVRERE